MGTRAAVTGGTVISAGVTAVWSWTAALTIGPPPPLHLGRNLPADYAQLAAAATGNGHALFAVTAGIYFACFLVSGLRRRKRQRLAAEDEEEQEPCVDQNRPARRSVYR